MDVVHPVANSPCKPCAFLAQFIVNLFLAADRLANAVTGGDPSETVSQRTARARAWGKPWARRFCSVLTAISRALGNPGDHCTASLEREGSLGRELVALSPAGVPGKTSAAPGAAS